MGRELRVFMARSEGVTLPLWSGWQPCHLFSERFSLNPDNVPTQEAVMTIALHPIGYVRSPYKKQGDAPRQGRMSDTVSEIVIDPAYRDGLLGLDERKHLIILSWFDRADRSTLRAIPPHDTAEHGVFAIRSPDRPNPIAICLVDLLGIHDGVLRVRGLDAFDGTPVIDIKPYFADIDSPGEEKKSENR
ncbi:MAG: S-adenosyl-L-methionine-binding protein [Methanoregula sp. PtaU1.Bin051]|nr:MAG: S-adenosyl-L-methionine-binding protein [Methanoregula sp. PtaU1.Bin051]